MYFKENSWPICRKKTIKKKMSDTCESIAFEYNFVHICMHVTLAYFLIKRKFNLFKYTDITSIICIMYKYVQMYK